MRSKRVILIDGAGLHRAKREREREGEKGGKREGAREKGNQTEGVEGAHWVQEGGSRWMVAYKKGWLPEGRRADAHHRDQRVSFSLSTSFVSLSRSPFPSLSLSLCLFSLSFSFARFLSYTLSFRLPVPWSLA